MNYKINAIEEAKKLSQTPPMPPKKPNPLNNNSFSEDTNKFNTEDDYDQAILSGRDWLLHQVQIIDDRTGRIMKLARVPITKNWVKCPKGHSVEDGIMAWYLIKEDSNGKHELRCQFGWHIMPRYSPESELLEKWKEKNLRGRQNG